LSQLIGQLVDAMQALPGVGAKGAQRMVYRLLSRDRDAGIRLAGFLEQCMREVGECEDCRTYCETAKCPICADARRDSSALCVVESPSDLLAIERTAGYHGRYFVLHGHLSPLDRVGPEDLAIPKLLADIQQRQVREVILATSSTAEGEATAWYIARALSNASHEMRVSRIAQGIPLGGELEYTDDGTISHALMGRTEMRS